MQTIIWKTENNVGGGIFKVDENFELIKVIKKPEQFSHLPVLQKDFHFILV